MTLFWVAILALSILLYVVLDGFDLGVGILYGTTRDETQRRTMLATISLVWDGNETWLIVAGTVLFGAFSSVYALLLSAFYLPVIAMLCALIFRGVAFEFRAKAGVSRPFWDAGFAIGSLVASFAQGALVGALAEGLPMQDGRYVGGPFGWLSSFAVLCGFGLCLGYALLGACWLVSKGEGEVRERAHALIPWLTGAVLVFLAAAFAKALGSNLRIMDRWLERPYLMVFPIIGLFAIVRLVGGLREHNDAVPLRMTVTIFLAAFCTLAVSFWPYMIPFQITIYQAVSPAESLSFMFWGAGLFVTPLILIYTVIAYRVFRGKVSHELHYH